MKPITLILLVVTVIMTMSVYSQHNCKVITINGKDHLKDYKWEIGSSVTCMDADDGINMAFANEIFAELAENGITIIHGNNNLTISFESIVVADARAESESDETDLESGKHGFNFMSERFTDIDEEVKPINTTFNTDKNTLGEDQFEFLGDVYNQIPEELGEEIQLPLIKPVIVPEGHFEFLNQYYPPMPEEEVEMPKI